MAETILVVEDDAKIVNLLRMYLEREGFAVSATSDGREALDVVARIHPHLVILDLMLPLVDGIDVCRKLRASSEVPILMLTARVDEVDRLLDPRYGRRSRGGACGSRSAGAGPRQPARQRRQVHTDRGRGGRGCHPR